MEYLARHYSDISGFENNVVPSSLLINHRSPINNVAIFDLLTICAWRDISGLVLGQNLDEQ